MFLSKFGSMRRLTALLVTLLLATAMVVIPVSEADAATNDTRRVAAVSRAINAWESFGAEKGTYYMPGSGWRGSGQYSMHSNDRSYPSIIETLQAGGHYRGAQPLYDPLDTSHTGTSSYAFKAYRCRDRVGVFSQSDGVKPTQADRDWWYSSGCNRSAIYGGMTYFQVSLPISGLAADGNLRAQRVGRVVTSFERFAAETGHYTVPSSGYKGRGHGFFKAQNSSYPYSIQNRLTQLGYLRSSDVLPASVGENDFLVYRCKDRIGVFSSAPTISASAADAKWWKDNACTRYPITYGYGYFQVSEKATGISANDARRISAVDQVVAGLESYERANGDYLLSGGGAHYLGVGWYKAQNSSSYRRSIANLLIAGNHLSGTPLYEPSGDMLVYRCRDRIGVFAKSDDIVASDSDEAWWATNACTRYPANSGYKYFRLARPTSHSMDDERAVVVGQVIDALEQYGAANDSYRVPGGSHNNGDGWYQYTNGTSYKVSIAQALVSAGLLPGGSNLPVDPWDLSPTGHTSFDLLVYNCKDRVGVFSRTDGATAAAADRSWWAANGCQTYPLTHSHPYFQISAPLPRNTCFGQTSTVELARGETATAGPDVIIGTEGPDTIVFGPGDRICGRGGDDTLRAFGYTSEVKVDGGPGNDNITHNGGGELNGGDGNDTITVTGGAHSLVLNGGAGNDTIQGGPTWEIITGGPGDDVIKGGDGYDTIDAGPGADQVDGEAGGDTIRGGDGADVLNGGADGDKIYGGNGNDLLLGEGGPDVLEGGAGNDELRGGDGVDTPDGGAGIDVCHDAGATNCESNGDNEPPTDFYFSVVPGLDSNTSLLVKWNGSTDNISVVGYEIHANGQKWGNYDPDVRSAWLTGLPRESRFDVNVRAVDDQGLHSTVQTVSNWTVANFPVYSTTNPMPEGLAPGACGVGELPHCPQWTTTAAVTTIQLTPFDFTIGWDGLREGTTTNGYEITVESESKVEFYVEDLNSSIDGTRDGELHVGAFDSYAPEPGDEFSVSVVATDGSVRSAPITTTVIIPSLPQPTPAPTPEPTPIPTPTPPPAGSGETGGDIVDFVDYPPELVFDVPPPADIQDGPIAGWECVGLGTVVDSSSALIRWSPGPLETAWYEPQVAEVDRNTGQRFVLEAPIFVGALHATFLQLKPSTQFVATIVAFDQAAAPLGSCDLSFTTKSTAESNETPEPCRSFNPLACSSSPVARDAYERYQVYETCSDGSLSPLVCRGYNGGLEPIFRTILQGEYGAHPGSAYLAVARLCDAGYESCSTLKEFADIFFDNRAAFAATPIAVDMLPGAVGVGCLNSSLDGSITSGEAAECGISIFSPVSVPFPSGVVDDALDGD